MPSARFSAAPIVGLNCVTANPDGVVHSGREGVRKLSTDDAAVAATAVLLREWRGSLREERLGIALANLYYDPIAAYAEVAEYGFRYADPATPVSYYRAVRAAQPRLIHSTPSELALIEAEAAANELAFATCANIFSAYEHDGDSIFDATYGVQVARAITTRSRIVADDEFNLRLAAMTGAGTRWRLVERMAGGQEPLGVARIRGILEKSLHEYGGPDQAFVDASHLGEVALKAFFDGVDTTLGSRGTRIPGSVFLSAAYRWTLESSGDTALTRSQRIYLWDAFRAGVTYCDTQHLVESLNQTLTDGASDTRLCPDCAEEIKLAARKCRFCGYELRPA